ncbi:hypothetical protein EON80_03085 [bacterium]|nr:MAG: hypothetical protein EON80_03085 [bacterium]
MKAHTITILLAGGALTAGLGAGYLLAGNTAGNATSKQTPATTPSTEGRSRSSASSAGNQAHNLSRLIQVLSHRQETGDPAAMRELERMSVAELRALIDELMANLPKGYTEESGRMNKLIDAALGEWYRREGEEALKQVDSMPKGEQRTKLLSQLTFIAARTDPAIARAWADRQQEELGKDWVHRVASEAARGAASRSADEYQAVRELFKDTPPGLSAYISYPEDFDFKKIVAVLPPGHESSGALVAWGARDPEAAWEMTRDLIAQDGEKGSENVTSIFHGISLVNDDAVAAEWLAEKIGEVPQEYRRRVFDMMWSVEFLGPERVNAVLSALDKQEDKMEFASALMGPDDDRNYAPLALKSLESDAAREQVMLKYARQVSRGMGREGTPHFTNMTNYINQTMEAAVLPTDAQERVRAALYKRE